MSGELWVVRKKEEKKNEETMTNNRNRVDASVQKRGILHNTDASVKSTLPPRFWSVATVFATFFGLLAVASE